MTSTLLALAAGRNNGSPHGIYSVCSAHPFVLEAALQQAKEDGSPCLIEATSNQVNQFGGYTGMTPRRFREYVENLACKVGMDRGQLILGGDHLGPNPWQDLPAEEAMQHAETMIEEYAAAGFSKLHLDASMACAGDLVALSEEVVASRAVRLCQAAEAGSEKAKPVYIVGTEVPVPGGAKEALHGLQVTGRDAASHTIAVHRRAFEEAGLGSAWQRVIGLVVQPGVEFDHERVVDYASEQASDLVRLLEVERQFVFEAHSTDYQRPEGLRELVRDGFAILKVGPALTFALREALYALSDIEAQLIDPSMRADLPQTVDRVMASKPKAWQQYYHGDNRQQALLRLYSYSDRIRYYWNEPEISAAVERLLHNVATAVIPETMLSRYFPDQYRCLRNGKLDFSPKAIILDKIRDVLRPYAEACGLSSQ